MTPTFASQKVEHANRLKREQAIGKIVDITYPQYDGLKHDCIINGFKVQDKTCIRKGEHPLFFVILEKKYKIGDNDVYWINVSHEDYSSLFYVLPEKFLIDHALISKTTCKHSFYLCFEKEEIIKKNKRYQEMNEYLFDYKKLDVQKLVNMFTIQTTQRTG